jgi:DNA-binding MarR family transcriptional regulator
VVNDQFCNSRTCRWLLRGCRLLAIKNRRLSINLLLEPSTGLDILNRMVKAGLLKEEQSGGDKRIRLVRLTPKGKAILKKAEQQTPP